MIFNKTTKELYKEASKVALDNAQMLFDEAQLLNREKYHARGFALGITSLEESVKALLFRVVSVGIFDAEKTRFFLHDHESKLEESGRILSSLAESAELLIGFIEKGKEYGLFTEADLIPKDYKKITELFQSLAKNN